MFKTPITKKAFDKVQQCQIDTDYAQRRVKGLNESVSTQQGNFVSPLLVVVGSYAAGILVGSQFQSVRKVDAETVVAKSSTALLLPLVSKAVALLTVQQKIKKMSLGQVDGSSDGSEPEDKPLHS